MNEHTAHMSKEGRILIPAGIRRALGIKPGDVMTLSVVDGGVRITRRLEAIRGMQRRLARLRDPARPAVDELLRERRSEGADV